MASNVPNIVLNNGLNIPQLGLGTWNSPVGEVASAVKDAIDAGYRHIDCAHLYGNEAEIGIAINEKIAEGVVTREDLFLTSKLWATSHRADLVLPALQTTLNDLDTPYVDLYLIHCPYAYKEGGDLFPLGEDGKIAFSSVDYLETWREMEKAVDAGIAKSIGISNFNKAQTERLLGSCRIKPVTNQVECHPYLAQLKLSDYLKSVDIVLTAYAPLCSPNRPWANEDDTVLLEDPKIVAIAEKYEKTTAQVLIRYQLQRGHVVIPKSVTKSRIIANLEVFDFELTDEEIAQIESFDCHGRLFPLGHGNLDSSGHPDYPFHDEY